MKKSNLFLSALALAVCAGNTDALAQNENTVVGNPGSENIMMIEEGYIVSTPAPSAVQNPSAPVQAAQPVNQSQPEFQPTSNNGATVLENITETSTPDSVNVEDDTLIVPND